MATPHTPLPLLPPRSYHHWKYAQETPSLQQLICERERLGNGRVVNAAVHGHVALMQRLTVDAVLTGHGGCVNHLKWNHNGTLLASGSDDTKLILWDYAKKTKREVIDTGHRLNIFAVCFVPDTNDHILATGAMDNDVRIHYAPFNRSRDATKRFKLHTGRVKDLATSQGVPKVFWSVAEDGLVYQFDVRALPRDDGRVTGENEPSGALIRLGKARHGGGNLRGMAMASHPLDATKLVVACGDFYARMYDRRMLRTQNLMARRHGTAAGAAAPLTSEGATLPVEIFAPPHLHIDQACDSATRRRHDDCHGTSIQFSSDGTDILANYHNDHIYLFRVHHQEPRHHDQEQEQDQEVVTPTTVYNKSDVPSTTSRASTGSCDWMLGMEMDHHNSQKSSSGSRNVLQSLYSRAMVLLVAKKYSAALALWMEICGSQQLDQMGDSFRKDTYLHTARAYLARAWRGDAYVASQYAKLAETLDPQDRDVQLTLIKALQVEKRRRQLVLRAKRFQNQFPDEPSQEVEQVLAPRHSSPSASSPSLRERRLRVSRRHGGGHSAQDADDSGADQAHSGVDSSGNSSSSSGEFDIQEDPTESDEEDENDHSGDEEEEKDDTGDHRYWTNRPLLISGDSQHHVPVNCDVSRRYIGYCNLQTDIKEANFFGPNDECIVAGSDDGRAYIWHKTTGKLIGALDADQDIVNCVQPHPVETCLATSGIENVIRLWTPTSDPENNDRLTQSDDALNGSIEANQANMAATGRDYYHSGGNVNSHFIRLIFQANEREGVQECATS